MQAISELRAEISTLKSLIHGKGTIDLYDSAVGAFEKGSKVEVDTSDKDQTHLKTEIETEIDEQSIEKKVDVYDFKHMFI